MEDLARRRHGSCPGHCCRDDHEDTNGYDEDDNHEGEGSALVLLMMFVVVAMLIKVIISCGILSPLYLVKPGIDRSSVHVFLWSTFQVNHCESEFPRVS